jgi:lipopolysaccharide transport system permease protein
VTSISRPLAASLLPFGRADPGDRDNTTVNITNHGASLGVSETLADQAAAGDVMPWVVIQGGQESWRREALALWEFRELLFFMVWRDVKTRYKQTALGIGWAVLQPVLTAAIFTIVFAYFARMPSEGLPYPLFAFTALLPWAYFSQALSRASVGLVSNANLISKVYFPRLILPLAAALTPVVDLLLTFVVLIGFLVWYQVVPTAAVLLLPVFIAMAFVSAVAISLWLSALNVKYRDVAHLIPFLIQVWMYASPVVYPVSLVPERWRVLYALNPMVTVVEGFRWSLLGGPRPDATMALVGLTVTLVTLAGGLWYFRSTERTFADVI